MLVLTRNAREKVVITLEDGRTIEVVIVEVNRSRMVRLGITAPPTVKIHRSELLEASNGKPRESAEQPEGPRPAIPETP